MPPDVRGRMRVLAIVAVTAAIAVGCTDDGGATEDFCTEVRSLPSLEAVLSRFSESDPEALEERITKARDAYQDLADAAPTEVAAAAEDVVALVEDILDAVADHPDDPTAAADQLRAVMEDHPDVERSRAEVAAFAEARCKVELDPTLSGSTTTDAATTTEATSTTGG